MYRHTLSYICVCLKTIGLLHYMHTLIKNYSLIYVIHINLKFIMIHKKTDSIITHVVVMSQNIKFTTNISVDYMRMSTRIFGRKLFFLTES